MSRCALRVNKGTRRGSTDSSTQYSAKSTEQQKSERIVKTVAKSARGRSGVA